MSKTILITGAASGFGKGTAIGLAKKGHKVIAGVEIAPQKTTLMQAAKDAGVEMEIIVLDITNPRQRELAFRYDIDVLMNNAGIMESGPVAEIPMEYVRRNYEVNVFGTWAMAQGFIPQMVKKGKGKIIFTTSMGEILTVPFDAVYTSTKHALGGLVAGLRTELSGTGVEICTVNPGAFGTGFNDRGMETMNEWFDPEKSVSNPQLLQLALGGLENQLDPQLMIDAMIRVAEEDSSKYRNVIPEALVPWLQANEKALWDADSKDAPIFVAP